jgi:hypothetical protein
MRPSEADVPSEFWRCIECKNPDIYIVVTHDKRVLLKTDLLVCFECGFRFYGKTLSMWYEGGQKQKKDRRRSRLPSPAMPEPETCLQS